MNRSRGRSFGWIAAEEHVAAEEFWESLRGGSDGGAGGSEGFGLDVESFDEDDASEVVETATVLAYNVQQSTDRLRNFLGTHGNAADALCFQEAGAPRFADITRNLNTYVAGANIGDPTLLATITQARASADAVLPIGAGVNGNRPALLTRLRSGLVIVNVHLTSGNPRRAAPELAAVQAYLERNYAAAPCLIIGDFNHQPAAARGYLTLAGPPHSSGRILDWAMARNVTSLAATRPIPRYHGSDHGPWGAVVQFNR